MNTLNFRAPDKQKKLNLYILADWHYGSPTCMVAAIKKVVARIKADPLGRWIAVGDLIENNIKTSPGSVYTQRLTPHEQIDHVVDILAPIADKCLAVVSGNHSDRTTRAVGIDPDKLITDLLGLKDKYFGYSVQGVIKIGKGQYVILAHHCTGGGTTPGGKTNALVKLRNVLANADIYIGAHTHADLEWVDQQPMMSNNSNGCAVRMQRQHFTSAGSTLSYFDSYGHKGAFKPASTCQMVLHLGDRVHTGGKAGAGAWSLPYEREVIRL